MLSYSESLYGYDVLIIHPGTPEAPLNNKLVSSKLGTSIVRNVLFLYNTLNFFPQKIQF